MGFSEWLMLQRNRADAVGQLSCRLIADVTGPLWANEPDAYRHYLMARGADPALLSALENALAEYAKDAAKKGRSWLST